MLENYTIPTGLQLYGGGDDFKPKIDWDTMSLEDKLIQLDHFEIDKIVELPIHNTNTRGLSINKNNSPLKQLLQCKFFSILVPGQTVHSTLKPLPIMVLFGKDNTKDTADTFNQLRYPDSVVDSFKFLDNIDSLSANYKVTIATPSIYGFTDSNYPSIEETGSYKNYISKNAALAMKGSKIDIMGKHKLARTFYSQDTFLELAIIDFFIRVLEKQSITEWINHVLDCIEKNIQIESKDHLHTIIEDLRITILSIFEYYRLKEVYALDIINYSFFNKYYQEYVEKYKDEYERANKDIDIFTYNVYDILVNLEDRIRPDPNYDYTIPYHKFIDSVNRIFDEFHDIIESGNDDIRRIAIEKKINIDETDKQYIYARLVLYIEVMEDVMYLTRLLFSDEKADMVFFYSNSSQVSRIAEILTRLMYYNYTTIYTNELRYSPAKNMLNLDKVYIDLEELYRQVQIKNKFYIKNSKIEYPEYEPGEPKGLLIGDMLLKKLTGPVSIDILVPKPIDKIPIEFRDNSLPVMMLFGDIHFSRLRGCDSCTIDKNCIAINQVEFLKGLDTIAKDIPTNVYIEQFYDPYDREMIKESLESGNNDAIHEALEAHIKFNKRSDYLTDLFENNMGCFIKEIRHNPMFESYCNSEYPQWHYLDVRNLTVSSYYKKTIYYETIYLGLLEYIESQKPIHNYLEYIADQMVSFYDSATLTEDNITDTFSIITQAIENFYSYNPKKIVELVFNSKYSEYSIIQKQFYKNSETTQNKWLEYFEAYIQYKLDRLVKMDRSTDWKGEIQHSRIKSKIEYILDKYYYAFDSNKGRFDFSNIIDKDDVISISAGLKQYSVEIKSAIADMYFLLRTFKVLPEDSIYSKLVIGYFGNAHTEGLTYFLTKIAKLYTIEYSIKSKENKRHYKNHSYRCLTFDKKLIDIAKIVEKHSSEQNRNVYEIPEELI